MLRVARRHKLHAVFQRMRVTVNCRKWQKQLEEIAFYLKSTLARSTNYDRAYAEKLSTASPGIPVGVNKPGSFFLFV